jgi:hypothetical protein
MKGVSSDACLSIAAIITRWPQQSADTKEVFWNMAAMRSNASERPFVSAVFVMP